MHARHCDRNQEVRGQNGPNKESDSSNASCLHGYTCSRQRKKTRETTQSSEGESHPREGSVPESSDAEGTGFDVGSSREAFMPMETASALVVNQERTRKPLDQWRSACT